jgi:glycosyltransferase involved in cell wall biosynthesis
MSLIEEVTSIDVFSPRANGKIEDFELPTKVRLFEFYNYDHPLSILKLLKVYWNSYDTVIFNMLPTGFGNSSTANAFGLMLPILLVRLFRQNNIKVIYHNSVFTNDVKTLGYNSPIDKIRVFFLSFIEKSLFRNVDTFVLLDIYKKRIDEAIGKNRVEVFKPKYLEAITTLYINKAMNVDSLEIEKSDIPIVLMHGSWGPQKNIELGLSTMRNLKKSGIKFRLIISGGINHHFSEYENKFHELLNSYSDVIDKYLGSVKEKEIIKIFLAANLLILPYNTPGGHSGVLEQAIFFERSTVAIDFPEYREQVFGIDFVSLANSAVDFSNGIRKFLIGSFFKSHLKVKEKVIIATKNVGLLLR